MINGNALIRDKSIDYIQPLAWSQDGKQVLATILPQGKIPQIVSVSVSDGSTKVLKTMGPAVRDWADLPEVAVSPDGRYLAYDAPQTDNPSHRDIFFLSADGSREGILIEHPADDYPLAWTPDGRTLLFSSDRSGQPCIWTIEVVDGKPQGLPRMLKSGLGQIMSLGFTPKGSFYYGINTGVRDLYTATFDFEMGKLLDPPVPVTQLFAGKNSSPDWSPDGSQLAYLSDRSRRNNPGGFGVNADTIVIRSLQTGKERELRPQLAVMGDPNGIRWSSDGRSFTLKATDEKGGEGVFRVDAQTGKVTTLLEGNAMDGVWQVAPTNDNKVLAFRRNDPAEKFSSVRFRNLETGDEREIVGGPRAFPFIM
jgi:Tol biopolymer transport system component